MNQGNTAACTQSPQAAAVAGSHRSGLSAGAIAGIVIGAILAALLLLLLLLCCLRRRKRSRRDAAAANTRSRGVEPHSASMVQARQASYASEKAIESAAPSYGGPAGAGTYGRNERGHPIGPLTPLSGGAPLAGGAYANNTRGVPTRLAAPASYASPGMGGAGYRGNEGRGLLSSAAYAPSSVPAQDGPGGSGVYGADGSSGRDGIGGVIGNGMRGGGGGVEGTGAGGAFVGNGGNEPWSHTTTTTTRTVIRSRPKT